MSLAKPFLLVLILAALLLLVLAPLTGKALGPALADLAPSTLDQPLTDDQKWELIESYTTDDSHALTKHPDVAMDVRRCLDNGTNPTYRVWVRSSKKIDVCDMLDGWFGFRVWKQIGGNNERQLPSSKASTANWSERTAYIRDEIHSFDDLLNYVKSEGWVLEQLVDGNWVTVYMP